MTAPAVAPLLLPARLARHRAPSVQFVLVLLLGALIVVSLGLGRLDVPPLTVVRILFAMATGGDPSAAGAPWTTAQWTVVEYVRIPRVLLATLSGIGLALCGAALQGLFRNPLVGPEVAGVSHGAAFGGVLAILWMMPAIGIVGFAFAGGMTALVIAFGLARLSGGASILAFVLSGVIVAAFFGAATGLVQYAADPQTQLPSIVYWLLGSFVGADMRKVIIVATAVAIAGTLIMLMRWRINLMSLGEVDARVLGVRTGLLRWFLVGLIAMIIAAQVSVSGGVGWIGLVVPHFGRMLVGTDHRVLLPTSALLGGIYLLAIDDVARTITGQEIPIGLLTALIGSPIFAVLFWRVQSSGWARE